MSEDKRTELEILLSIEKLLIEMREGIRHTARVPNHHLVDIYAILEDIKLMMEDEENVGNDENDDE